MLNSQKLRLILVQCSYSSLGGFTVLVAAAVLQEQVKGVVLLNSAGQFGDAINESSESEETALQKFILEPVKEIFQRIVLGFLFWQAKQPARIQSVLKSVCLTVCLERSEPKERLSEFLYHCLIFSFQVYINSSNVDDYLINSITRPADDPNAGEVYYRYRQTFQYMVSS